MPTTKKNEGNGAAALMEAPEGLAPGSSGDDVELLQNYLTRFGYLASPPSKEDGRKAELDLRPMAEPGEFDDATEEAIRQFQTIAGLPQRGTTIDRSSAGIDVSVGSLGGPRPTPHTQTEAASPDDLSFKISKIVSLDRSEKHSRIVAQALTSRG